MKYLQFEEEFKNMFANELESVVYIDLIADLKKAKKIIVYGAGNGGKYTKYLLSKIKLEVNVFLDKNAGKISELDGIPVNLPEDKFEDDYKNGIFVIVSVGNANAQIEITTMLHGYGYSNVISYMELFNSVFLTADDRLASTVNADYYYENKNDILRALKLFEEYDSCKTYFDFIRGHALCNKSYFPQPVSSPKYLPDDLNLKREYKNTIDCGAANGETFLMLERNNVEIENIFMFEPDKYNFQTLMTLMKNKGRDIEGSALLWPCAVNSDTGYADFIHSGTAGSNISATGKELVQTVALDDVLVNISPSFIKMDIEGSEYEALLGAKGLICKFRPDIAICVYHSVNHIWDIPLLLESWNLNYKFYLRSHTIYGMNTVLYVTSC